MKVNDVFETKGFYVTDTFVKMFADITADMNPIHLDEEYAKTTRFGKRIAHGMLTAGFISATISKHFPGAIYLNQSLRFERPVFLDDTILVRLKVKEIKDNKILLETVAWVGFQIVLSGEAKILI